MWKDYGRQVSNSSRLSSIRDYLTFTETQYYLIRKIKIKVYLCEYRKQAIYINKKVCLWIQEKTLW